MISTLMADSASALRFEQLGLSPVLFDFGLIKIRYYSLAYIGGIMIGWWYLLRLLAQPGAPMARRHADDFVFYATIGILLGGRIAYSLFYDPAMWANPVDVLKVWHGGMSFHGGMLGVTLAVVYMCRKHGLNWLRVHDYVAVCAPFGLFLGRLANFVNGELWGRVTNVPWAIIFPGSGDGLPRHPSQLYEAGLEGIVLFIIMWWTFWKTDARYQPGRLVGTFLLGYGVARFIVELFRQPDRGLEHLSWGLSMGQTLCVPMIAGGIYFIATAKGRAKAADLAHVA